MVQLHILILGGAAGEAVWVESLLRETGFLKTVHWMPVDQALEKTLDGRNWDLVILGELGAQTEAIWTRMEQVFQKPVPPVFVIIQPFDSLTCCRLINAGVRRVLPRDGLELTLKPALESVFPEQSNLAGDSPVLAAGVWDREDPIDDLTDQKNLAEALQRALQKERQLGEMRSGFLSMTSHELRTPLSTILLSASLLLDYGEKWEPDKRQEHLSRLRDAALHMESMLNDLLLVSRLESGRFVSSPKNIDLIEFISQVIDEARVNDQGMHTIRFHSNSVCLPVCMDAAIMRRVVDNLLSNAVKYSPAGTEIALTLTKEDQTVLLEVQDHGIGIPERDADHLFQAFRRGSNTTNYPGTGIGLLIIQKAVELMNGTVSFQSTEGQGATFWVRLPI